MPETSETDPKSVRQEKVCGDAAELRNELDALRDEKEAITRQIGKLKSQGDDASELIERARELTEQIDRIESAEEPDDDAGAEEQNTGDEEAGRWSTEVITETEKFEALREDWGGLIEQADASSPFMRWEWLFPWWKYFGGNKKLRLITVRDGAGELVAIAPLMIGVVDHRRFRRDFSPRTLAFIGSGSDGPASESFQPVVRQGVEEDAFARMWQAIEDMQEEWISFHLQKVDDSAATWRMLASWTSRTGNGVLVEPASTAACASLPDNYEDFVSSVPSERKRGYLRNQYAKLREAFPNVELRTHTSIDEIADAIEPVMDLNVKRQNYVGQESNWAVVERRKCLIQAAQLLSETGNLRVTTLSIDGRAVAGVIAPVGDSAVYVHVLGFDPELGDHHVMEPVYGELIRSAIEDGLSRFDWFSDHPYQRDYVSETRQMLNVDIFNADPASFEVSIRQRWLRGLRRRIWSLMRLGR